MAAGFSRWPMLKNSDFWISRFDIWLQHGLLHRPRLKNYSNRTNIDTFRAKSVWRPFCFFTWLTCFFEKVHAKEHSCQIWCLYHKVKYWPLFFKLAAPLEETLPFLQCAIIGNVQVNWPKLFQDFLSSLPSFFHACVHSIIPHQHM